MEKMFQKEYKNTIQNEDISNDVTIPDEEINEYHMILWILNDGIRMVCIKCIEYIDNVFPVCTPSHTQPPPDLKEKKLINK